MRKILSNINNEVKIFEQQIDLFKYITEELGLVITKVIDGEIIVTDKSGENEKIIEFGYITYENTKENFEKEVIEMRTELRKHSDALKAAGLPLSEEQIHILVLKFGFLPKK